MLTPPEMLRSSRDFAAWLGLTPKDHSTDGRQRLGGIAKAGDSALRSVLIVGATALLRHVRKGRHRPTAWLAGLLERKPPKPVAVALANNFARIAWRLMVSGGFSTRRFWTKSIRAAPGRPLAAPLERALRQARSLNGFANDGGVREVLLEPFLDSSHRGIRVQLQTDKRCNRELPLVMPLEQDEVTPRIVAQGEIGVTTEPLLLTNINFSPSFMLSAGSGG
jgi:hypothetical protein